VNGWLVIILGLLLVATGGFLGFLGDHLNKRAESERSSKELNTKIGEVLTTIENAKRNASSNAAAPAGGRQTETPSRSDTQRQLETIGQNFSDWATQFLHDRSAKRQELDNLKLQAKGEEQRISDKCRPVFQYALNVLEGSIAAYNKTAGTIFVAKMNPLPQNLYDSVGNTFDAGTISFGNLVWRVEISIYRPPRDDSPPVFFLTVPNPTPGQSADSFRIEVRPTFLYLKTTGGGGIAAIANVDGNIPIDSYEQPLRHALERLLEAQITSLGQNN
jgi:hypothetical protein